MYRQYHHFQASGPISRPIIWGQIFGSWWVTLLTRSLVILHYSTIVATNKPYNQRQGALVQFWFSNYHNHRKSGASWISSYIRNYVGLIQAQKIEFLLICRQLAKSAAQFKYTNTVTPLKSSTSLTFNADLREETFLPLHRYRMWAENK